MEGINFMVQLPQFIKKKTSDVPGKVFINRQNKPVKRLTNFVPSQSKRTTITQFTNSTFPKKLGECSIIKTEIGSL